MSKRTIKTILIIILLILIGVFLFLYFHKKAAVPPDNGNTNTYSGFGNNTNSGNTPPANISGTGSTGNTTVVPPKLRKVSSMPIAGFGVYTKERLKSLAPPVIPPTTTDSSSTTGNNSGSTTTTSSDSSTSTSANTDTNASTTTTTAGDANTPATTSNATSDGSATAPAPTTTTITQKYTVIIKGKKVIKTRKVVVPVKPPPGPPVDMVTAVRYMARASGNVYETFADVLNEQKFSSTMIPMVYNAYFNANAQSVVLQYLKDDDRTIETFAGSLPDEPLTGDTTGGNNELKGSFLAENITGIDVSPDKSKIFYMFNTNDPDNNTVTGLTSGFLGDAKAQVLGSPFTEWLSQWASPTLITLTTKPTNELPGYMYTIDLNQKNPLLAQDLSNVNGLTTLTSPDGKFVLYSNDKLSLNIYNETNKSIIPLAIATMAEKCVWGKASDVIYCAVPKSIPFGIYPDSWYKGDVSFSDSIWKITVKDGTATLLVDPLTVPGGEDIDGIKLALDTDQNYLFFVNKKDSFLWEFDLRP